MTTTTIKMCALCGENEVSPDRQYCEANGCNKLEGETYKELNQLKAAQKIASYLMQEFHCTPGDVMRLNTVGRRLVERELEMGERSDTTWALAAYCCRD